MHDLATEAAPAAAPRRRRRPCTLVTGGAGFVGTNLALRLRAEGRRVRVLDNLERPGAERNLKVLLRDGVEIARGDVRDPLALRQALENVDTVFHLAAQVAVTTSLADPLADFAVNTGGTLQLLEELRRLGDPPPLLLTSTNKVYGSLADVVVVRSGRRWEPADAGLRSTGVDERRKLEFCSPYGCSKGAADQYVLDYARSYGLTTAVFRMSCIYGAHQHGTEDQGWVAHFLACALARRPITLCGDGAQVRDVLFVADLVEAMIRWRDAAPALAGEVFNVGGGPASTLSLLEALDVIAELTGARPALRWAEARRGDQRWYVSDTRKLERATGWQARVPVDEGLESLCRWLSRDRPAQPVPARRSRAAAAGEEALRA
jgi:CDP-paratose 2-epimerase